MTRFSDRIYRALLRLYPADHRREYGDLMAQAFRDLYNDAYRGHGVAGLGRLWLTVLADTALTAAAEHRAARAKRSESYSTLDLVMVMLPILAIIGYLYGVHGYGDTAIVYVMMLIAGTAAWGLSRLKLIPTNPVVNAYTTGIVLGIGSVLVFMLGSLPAFGVYRLGLPPIAILVVSFVLYVTGSGIVSRWSGGSAREFGYAAGLLGLTAVAAQLATSHSRTVDEITRYVSLNYAWMQALAVLITTTACIRLMRRWGRVGLIALMVALGVQLVVLDPAYFTGQAERWINLTLLLLPLVLCPLWWLLASTRRARVAGTFALWTLLTVIVAFAPTIARDVLGLTPNEPAGMGLYRALQTLPYFAAMALALRAASAGGQPDADQPAVTAAGGGPTEAVPLP